MFRAGEGFWCNGKEIAHFDSAGVVDLRLTKPVIRELRAELRADERIRFRGSGSDWIEVHVSRPADVDFAVRLAERAAEAHRAAPGATPKPPPQGADLERRRRFH
jgi:hypothetical protein